MLAQAYLYLFNKGKGFQAPFIPEYVTFETYTETADEALIRELLGLHEQLTDYYALSYLSLFDRHPEIKKELDVPHTAFSVEDYIHKESELNGGVLRVTEKGEEGFTRVPNRIPVNFYFTISYLNTTEVNIFTPTFTRNTSYTNAAHAGNRLLSIVWGEDIPFSGSVIVPTWQMDDQFTLTHRPISFPYAAALSSVIRTKAHMRLLNKAKVVDQFIVAESDTEKLGWLILALINTTYARLR